jgi:single-stranded-DNA-specific exonuclease
MGETESHGSCRSIDEFHITDALDQVGHLLLRHGGHAQAAGFVVTAFGV